VQAFLSSQPGVEAVHHLHIWPLGANEIALTAHLVRPEDQDHDAFIDATTHALDHRFSINHATLQIERGMACGHDLHDAAPHHSH
jgi:cobalt-zinc-cadmium efflux system protein